MKEKKYNLFFDYLNSYNAEHIKKNIYRPSNKNINTEYNSISLKEKIKERKKAFNNIFISINKILNKYKNNNNINNINNGSNKENQDINIKTKLNNNKNVNRIAEHLINTFSKEELKLIKEKINNKMEEDDEPKPEIYLPNYYIKNKKSNTKFKIVDNLINKNKTFDKIKLNIENKNQKKNFNNKNIIKRNSNNNNNIQINSTFLTYVKCKTSFEYLDNLIKKQKNKKYNKIKTEFNLKNKNKTPNRSTNISSKYLIKTKIKKEKDKEEKNECTYTPIKYINHKYDYITSLYKNDKFLMKRIKDKMNNNSKKYQKIKEEQNKEILDQCTFKPIINKTKAYLNKNNKIKHYLTETDNKNMTYIDFYTYKKNMERKQNNKREKSEFHQLIIQKSLKELNDSKS